MKLNRVIKDEAASMPICCVGQGKDGWAQVKPPENGIVVMLSSLENMNSGVYITDTQLAELGYVRKEESDAATP